MAGDKRWLRVFQIKPQLLREEGDSLYQLVNLDSPALGPGR